MPAQTASLRLEQFIQLFHFLFCFSDVLCSGANAGLDIFRLSHHVNQVFLVFLKGESTGLSGDPGDDDNAIGDQRTASVRSWRRICKSQQVRAIT